MGELEFPVSAYVNYLFFFRISIIIIALKIVFLQYSIFIYVEFKNDKSLDHK